MQQLSGIGEEYLDYILEHVKNCYKDRTLQSLLYIYLRSLGSQKPGKAQQSNSYIATSNLETLTDDKRRRITWNK